MMFDRSGLAAAAAIVLVAGLSTEGAAQSSRATTEAPADKARATGLMTID